RVRYRRKEKKMVRRRGRGKGMELRVGEKVRMGKEGGKGGKGVVIEGKEGIVRGVRKRTLGGGGLGGWKKAGREG
ncbi:hypothetical protein, partial [Neisseria sicca]|uniref:hypothetical protein n=1 Tax=Neisseria sicca TaxID=490 RepID=UPI001649F18F